MIDDQTILLRQILDELKQQNHYLFEIHNHPESFRGNVVRELNKAGGR